MGGLWPATTGGRVRSLNTISELARDHQVTVITTHGHGDDPDGLKQQLAGCERVISVPYAVPEARQRRVCRRRRALLVLTLPGRFVEVAGSRGAPRRVRCARRRQRRPLRRRLSVCGRQRADATRLEALPVLLFEHNVEYLIWQRLANLETSAWKRTLFEMEWRKLRACEADACRRAAAHRHRLGRRPAAARGAGRRSAPCRSPPASTPRTSRRASTPRFPDGSCSAARWTGIRTRTRSAISPTRFSRAFALKCPNVSFTIVGRNPSARVRELAARPGDCGHRNARRRAARRLPKASVYVVPLRAGSGTRIKIFEALSMGKAVVSTSVGAEGLALESGRHFLAADTAARFCPRGDPAAARPGAAPGAWRRRTRAWSKPTIPGRQVARQFEAHCEEVVAEHAYAGREADPWCLICHEQDRLDTEGLASWLASSLRLAGLIIIRDPRSRRWRAARREIRRVGWLRFLDVVAFRAVRAPAAGATRRGMEGRRDRAPAPALPRRPDVGAAHRRLDAELGRGARVSRAAAARPRHRALQDHSEAGDLRASRESGRSCCIPGICPEYRNAHGCFWALARRDLDRVGMTLLRVDPGIDTGPIFLHGTYDFDEVEESHAVIQYRAGHREPRRDRATC